jgi:phosphatidylethanolamine-binding protein (PEBP) family uncharacterized protein
MHSRARLDVSGIRVQCGGPHTPPVFSVTNKPAAAKYMAVTFIDVDPRAHGFVHWLQWDVNDGSRGREGTNSLGFKGYGAPCPPMGAGPHTYVFTVYMYRNKLPAKQYTYETLVPALHAAGVEDLVTQTLQFKS